MEKRFILIDLWQKISFLFPACRYYPTCSEYSKQSYKTYGFLTGTLLTLKRIIKCNPIFEGGIDLVPKTKKGEVAKS